MKQPDAPIDVPTAAGCKLDRRALPIGRELLLLVNDWTHHLAKPFGALKNATVADSFCHGASGLQLCPGMTVLEFGAGTCWAARIVTQLGCQVIACDVSASALQIGRELYQS